MFCVKEKEKLVMKKFCAVPVVLVAVFAAAGCSKEPKSTQWMFWPGHKSAQVDVSADKKINRAWSEQRTYQPQKYGIRLLNIACRWNIEPFNGKVTSTSISPTANGPARPRLYHYFGHTRIPSYSATGFFFDDEADGDDGLVIEFADCTAGDVEFVFINGCCTGESSARTKIQSLFNNDPATPFAAVGWIECTNVTIANIGCQYLYQQLGNNATVAEAATYADDEVDDYWDTFPDMYKIHKEDSSIWNRPQLVAFGSDSSNMRIRQ